MKTQPKHPVRLCPSSRFPCIIIVSSSLIVATGPRISFRVLRQNSSSLPKIHQLSKTNLHRPFRTLLTY